MNDRMEQPVRLPRKILCVDGDQVLVRSRCLVLEHGGYSASCAGLKEAGAALKDRGFNLVLFSERLSPEDSAMIRNAVPESAKVLEIPDFLGPRELLALVEAILAGRDS